MNPRYFALSEDHLRAGNYILVQHTRDYGRYFAHYSNGKSGPVIDLPLKRDALKHKATELLGAGYKEYGHAEFKRIVPPHHRGE